MIFKATVRAHGKLGRHLLNAENNEAVTIGGSRDVEPNVGEALMHFAALGAAAGCHKPLWHVIANPDMGERPMTEEEWDAAWGLYEAEFHLATHPFVEVRHQKKGRHHRHRVYSRVDPDSGRIARDSYVRIRNEKVARMCDATFGHRVFAGKHHHKVLRAIAKERPDLLAKIAVPGSPSSSPVLGPQEIQQGERTGTDARGFRRAVCEAFTDSGGDWRGFAAGLDRRGITIAKGDRAMLVVNEATGFYASVSRVLREEGRAVGRKIDVKDGDVRREFLQARPFLAERMAGFQRARERAEREDGLELFRANFEALQASDLKAVQREVEERRKSAGAEREAKERLRSTLQQERERIRIIGQNLRDRRKRRIDRAYRLARVGSSPTVQKWVSFLVGAGLLMSGLGVAPALGGLFLARHGLGPALRARARAIRRAEQNVTPGKSEPVRVSPSDRFDFNTVARADRPLVGLYLGLRQDGLDGDLNWLGEACQTALGSEAITKLHAFAKVATPKQMQFVRSWYRPDLVGHRSAAAAALRRCGQHGAASRMLGGTQPAERGGVEP